MNTEQARKMERDAIGAWLEQCAANCFNIRDDELEDGDYVAAMLSDEHGMVLVGLAIEIIHGAHLEGQA